MWHVTHNTFTEVSSESGIPGLAFYLAALIFTFRAAAVPKIRRVKLTPRIAEICGLSSALRLSLFAFVVSGMFGSFALQTQFLTLAAFAVVFSRTGAAEVARFLAEQKPPTAETSLAPIPPHRVSRRAAWQTTRARA
jgi:O-antigen ligase